VSNLNLLQQYYVHNRPHHQDDGQSAPESSSVVPHAAGQPAPTCAGNSRVLLRQLLCLTDDGAPLSWRDGNHFPHILHDLCARDFFRNSPSSGRCLYARCNLGCTVPRPVFHPVAAPLHNGAEEEELLRQFLEHLRQFDPEFRQQDLQDLRQQERQEEERRRQHFERLRAQEEEARRERERWQRDLELLRQRDAEIQAIRPYKSNPKFWTFDFMQQSDILHEKYERLTSRGIFWDARRLERFYSSGAIDTSGCPLRGADGVIDVSGRPFIGATAGGLRREKRRSSPPLSPPPPPSHHHHRRRRRRCRRCRRHHHHHHHYLHQQQQQQQQQPPLSNFSVRTAFLIQCSQEQQPPPRFSLGRRHILLQRRCCLPPSLTLTSREIQTAGRLLLPGELAKHAVSEDTKAVTKYSASQ
jgi:hypothetical protein